MNLRNPGFKPFLLALVPWGLEQKWLSDEMENGMR